MSGNTEKEREDKLREVSSSNKYDIVHPYNDYRVIAGQATVAKEFYE